MRSGSASTSAPHCTAPTRETSSLELTNRTRKQRDLGPRRKDPECRSGRAQQHLPLGFWPPSFAEGVISIDEPAPGRCDEMGSASSCFCETIL